MRIQPGKSLVTVGCVLAVALMACADGTPTGPSSELSVALKGPPAESATCLMAADDPVRALCEAVEGTETEAALVTFTNERDLFTSIAKLNEASDKLAEGKIGDAIQKVEDFRSKIVALAEAGKPKISGDVAGLLALTDTVLAGLQALLETV